MKPALSARQVCPHRDYLQPSLRTLPSSRFIAFTVDKSSEAGVDTGSLQARAALTPLIGLSSRDESKQYGRI
ncbi:hypothetical protein KIH32_01980 [Pseudomonas fluorescens]|uniref:hypothetical protein n=1 Tax=Pseudomonas fluorescens TaxID=294 RepID=UPI001BD9426A|nr:hypothetical protein [Pseudomonas fluorescens]MBT0622659.1 hypothetical protein [Pseudomonas fluorescens]